MISVTPTVMKRAYDLKNGLINKISLYHKTGGNNLLSQFINPPTINKTPSENISIPLSKLSTK